MHIDILYFEGCPNHRDTVALVKRVVSELGVNIHVRETAVGDREEVKRLRFLGSPTVLVNGIDMEPTARHRTDYSYSCRVYCAVSGLPPEEWVVTVLTSAAPIYRT